MERYQVRMTKQAREDIQYNAAYIRDTLLNPQAAENMIKALKEGILSLDCFPKRCSCTEEEPWHSMEIRKMIIKGYYVYYQIDEAEGTVNVIGVVYGRQDQVRQLSSMNIE